MTRSTRNICFTLLLAGIACVWGVNTRKAKESPNELSRRPMSSYALLLGQRKVNKLYVSASKPGRSRTRGAVHGANAPLYSDVRKRRSTNDVDERILIQSNRGAQLFPYSSVVKLSIECTATLVGRKYALTAAHCIHDGIKFTTAIQSLKVGLLQRRGTFHWIRVRKAFISKRWIKEHAKKKNDFFVAKHDYALLELWRPHGRRVVQLSTDPLQPGTRIRFAGFHSDKTSNSMWLSYCRVIRKRSALDLVFSFCDGEKGVSGSAVLINSQGNSRVVGIVAGFAISKYKDTFRKFNAANILTKRKVQQICKWMGIGKNCKYTRTQ